MNRWGKAARLASIILVTALLGTIIAFADREKTVAAFTGIKWRWAIWVPVINIANTFVEGLRLATILLPLTSKLKLRNCFNSMLVAILGNTVLPLRFGDGARTYYIAKTEKIGLSSAISAIMLDRIADFLIFFAIMAVTAILCPFPPSIRKTGLAAGLILSTAVLVAFALARTESEPASNPSGGIRRKIYREAGNFARGLSAMKNTGLLLPILFISALSWLLRGSILWFMFQAFSLDLPAMAAPVVLIVLNLGIAAVSTPANVGGFELAVIGALNGLFSIDMGTALSYAVALHAIEVIPMVIFGIFFLWHEGFHVPLGSPEP